MSFTDLGLSPKVLSAIEAAGYTEATPIQAEAIPVAITGRDVLGIAQTGTGKTASFVLPILTRLEKGRARARMPRSLILAPTRELAAQVAESFEKYGTNHKLTLALLIGGVSFADQTRKLDRGVDVLIATPGRLLDHFQRGKVLLTGVEILVIDEADRMLDMGFIPDIEKICKLLSPRRQTLFFSATMPNEIKRLVASFLKDPVRVEVARQASVASTIEQKFMKVPSDPRLKRQAFRELLKTQDVQNAIIFCNRKRDVAVLNKSLQKHGFNSGELHGDMEQRARMATLDDFRNNKITYLVASDVAARGLDVPEVSHVFNFDIPYQAEDYVHRIGRTGRAGREGYAATLVTPADSKALRAIESMAQMKSSWIGEEVGGNAAPASSGSGASGSSSSRGRAAGASRGEGAGGRGRGGRGRKPADRNNPRSNDGKPASGVNQKAETQADTQPPVQTVDAKENIAKRSDAKPDAKPSGAKRTDKNERKSESKPRNERANQKGSGNKKSAPVTGLGDHVPDFMKRR